VFAASDVMAFELIDVARANNVAIPDDLSVIGFDDNPLSVNSSVRLTTVAQPLMEMGRLGVEHLKQISEAQAPLPFKLLLPAKLITRASTSACTENKV
jgi:LacI family transcriptional regulator